MKPIQFLSNLAGAAVLGLVVGCGNQAEIAYITNGVDPFWEVARSGVEAGVEEFGQDCEALMPADLPDQKRMMESLVARGVKGIAISPIDAANQTEFINQIAEQVVVITHDSDAPDSDRVCFVGMNNYSAGRAAGRMIKEAIPDGGEVMIFVGRLEQLNAQQRRQGIIDELLDRPEQSLDSLQISPNNAALEGDKYTILDTRTDNFEYSRAKANAEDAITANPNLACMVGLFAYNIPACLEAVKGADKTDEIALVSFDEQEAVLQGIIDGTVHGTISQQPFEYGYHSVRILTGLINGDQSVIPESGTLEVAIKEVRQDNVEAFWEDLKKLTGETE